MLRCYTPFTHLAPRVLFQFPTSFQFLTIMSSWQLSQFPLLFPQSQIYWKYFGELPFVTSVLNLFFIFCTYFLSSANNNLSIVAYYRDEIWPKVKLNNLHCFCINANPWIPVPSGSDGRFQYLEWWLMANGWRRELRCYVGFIEQ